MFWPKIYTFMTFIVTCKCHHILRDHINVNEIPDVNKKTVDFIIKYGYPGEMHEVLTKDDYILTLYRISHTTMRTTANSTRPVILLQHGIVLSSDQWVLRGTEDLGYDVWMSNTRGTSYSRHSTYSKTDEKFWDYSLDELGNNDLSAIIDYILNVTNRPHLTYVGHSRGVAMAVILLSSQPEYNAKINLFLGLAPVIYSKEAKCPLFELAGNRPSALMKISTLEQFFKNSKITNLLYTTKNTRMMINFICQSRSILQNICPYMSFLINGEDFEMFNKSLIPLMISHFTLGVGAKELLHLLQISESDFFRPFDYGKKANIRLYGSEKPKPYNLSRIIVPTYLYYGPNDLFVSERDFFKFARQLPNFQGHYKVPYRKFNHIDYMFAKNANELLYPHIIAVTNKYNKKIIN